MDAAALVDVLARERVHDQEASARTVPRRLSRYRLSTWFCLLWGMALLGLLLLPSSYRAGAASAHPHSLIQLWADASNGTIRHHLDHGLAHPAPGFSSSWFDPSVSDTETPASVGSHNEKPDAAEHQESAPVSSGMHLLLTAMTVIVAMGTRQTSVEPPGRRRHGLSPRILVPPPRWTLAAS